MQKDDAASKLLGAKWKKGQSGNPKGRPKGSLIFKRDLLLEQRRIEIAKRAGITPLEYMVSIMRDEGASRAEKFAAANAAMPYMHARKMREIDLETPEERSAKVRKMLAKAFAQENGEVPAADPDSSADSLDQQPS